jgi:hypothetical protein
MTTVVLISDNSVLGGHEWSSGGDSSETGGVRSVQVGLLGTGSISATVVISGANDCRFPIKVAEFTLSGTNLVTDAVDLMFPFEFYRAEITAIAGTNARVTAVMKV